MNITERIKKLRLPLGQYVIVGSGILEALGIRSANDVDIAVTPELFKKLQTSGVWEEEERYGKLFLKQEGIDIIPQLSWSDYPTTTAEAITSALVIEDIPFMNLEELKRFKSALGREKDRVDIALIETYQREKAIRHRAAVFVIDKNRVLLFYRLKNGREYYAVPGGGVEPSETPEQTAMRELKEETNLDITLGEKIGEFEADGNHQYFYIAKSWSGTPTFGGEELERQSPANVYRLEWVPIEELNNIDLRDEARKILLRYLGPLP